MHKVLETEESMQKVERWNFRRMVTIVFGCMIVASAIAARAPAIDTLVRLILLSTLGVGIFTALLYVAPYLLAHPRSLYPAFFFIVLIIVWMVLADRPPKADMLQTRYVSRLRAFEGVRFAPGGETHRGIDCSGLARTAMWQAMLHEGIKEANPRLVGINFWRFWWRDMSAQDMLEGKYGYTRVVGRADKIAGCDTSELEIGDMAITGDGAHVLIYIGKNQWADAAPDYRKVHIGKAPVSSERGWYNVPVVFVRWWIFEDTKN